MRQVEPKVIEERKKKILKIVIHRYIKTGRPVGSSVINDEYKVDLSPATIRNLMADLEEEGYLSHPHTSAGRIPTDKGYRLYVDSLIELQKLVIEEEQNVRNEYNNKLKELNEVLIQTSKVLSTLSHYSGFLMTPKVAMNKLQYIELLHLSANKILVILVTHSGMVNHKIIESNIPREKLIALSNMLNDKLKGLTLVEAKRRVIKEIEDAERNERELFNLVKELGREIFEIEENIYIDGTTNVLALPEFQDYEPVRSLLRLNEDKDILLKILDKDLTKKGVGVRIGSEVSFAEFKDLSIVTSVYNNDNSPIGVLGIIGPKRMEYPKMMVLVSAVSSILNKILSENK